MNVLIFLLLFVGVFVLAVLGFAALMVARVVRMLHLDSLFGLRSLFGGRSRVRNGSGSTGERHTKSRRGGNTVVDTRTQDAANRKIYDDSDGEYVDYVAVKE